MTVASLRVSAASLWVPETLFSSRDLLIFVDEAAESVEPADAVNVGCASLCDRT